MLKRILVVDDDAMNLTLAEFILKQNNYSVLKAESGAECLRILNDKVVDLVLLDIEMPLMNGIKTLEKIREREDLKHLKVIFLTADSNSSTVVEAALLNADDYIKKPFLPQELLTRVEKVLNGRKTCL